MPAAAQFDVFFTNLLQAKNKTGTSCSFVYVTKHNIKKDVIFI